MSNPWRIAADLGAKTPASRNRAADFLRAASILVVVLGHWLMAAPWMDQDGSHIDHMLAVSSWTQWLTWGLQVMPVFFFVGGFSNGVTWEAARRDGLPYRDWLDGRLRRLLGPVMLLLTFWLVGAAIGFQAGVPADMIRIGSQVALIPTWFLAVYLVVMFFVPVTRAAWRRWGMASFWAPALAAAAFDYGYFALGWRGPGWTNYLLVWTAVHQLGYAWHAGRFGGAGRAALWAVGGLAALILLTEFGPYPRSMVGVPHEEVSNTTPPHLPLLALAALQFGLAMLAERPLRRWLERPGPWTATVLVNGMIMTVYLWHSTVMMLLFGLAILLGGLGLWLEPGSGVWWLGRVPWIAVFLVGLLPFLGVFGRFERSAGRGVATAAWRQILGGLLSCAGLARLAYAGAGADNPLGLAWVSFALAFSGALLAGLLRLPLRAPAPRPRP